MLHAASSDTHCPAPHSPHQASSILDRSIDPPGVMAHGGKAQGSLQITLQIADLKMRIARLNAKVSASPSLS